MVSTLRQIVGILHIPTKIGQISNSITQHRKTFLTDGKNRKCRPFIVFEMPGDKRMVFDVEMTDEEFAAIKDYSGECDYENMNNIRNMIESLKTLFDLKAIYNEYNDLLKHKGKAARRNFNKMLKRI